MGGVAASALIVAFLRPILMPVPAFAGGDILEKFGPKVHPDLNRKSYRAESARKTPSGYWQVRFVRVAGDGPPHQDVMVSDGYVTKSRLHLLIGGERPDPTPPNRARSIPGRPIR